MHRRNLWVTAMLVVFVGQSTLAQNAPSKAQAARPTTTRAKPVPAYTVGDNSFTLNLDRHGTSFGISYPDQGFTSPPSGGYTWVAVVGSFKTSQGCNSWFGKSAIFILDESSTITVPGPAQCPLPPSSRTLPIWMLESISNAHLVKLQLDGGLFEITKEQLAALRAFVDERKPSQAWREEFEPYAIPRPSVGASSAYVFATLLIDQNRPGDVSYVRASEYSGGLVQDSSGITATYNYTWGGEGDQVFANLTYTIPWNGLTLDLVRVGCNDCVFETKHLAGTSRHIDDTSSSKQSLMFSPFGPGSDPRVREMYIRAVTYLWYEHMYVNVSR